MISNMKEKIKNWLKEPYNRYFLAVIIISFIIRFYYFWMTKNQPIWWDESEYMSQAKGLAGRGYTPLEVGYRLPGFPLFMSLFFIFNLTNEALMRFIALFIPSIILIVLTYLVIKEMYPSDKKIALISTLIMTVLWEHLFYSNRFHTENFSLIFEFLIIIVLFVCYIKKKDFIFIKHKYYYLWIILFTFFLILFRPGNIIFIPAVFAFFIILNSAKIFQKKYTLWIILSLVILIFAGIFILNLPKAGFLKALNLDSPIGWNTLGVFGGFYQSFIPNIPSIFFYSFILGILFLIFNIILSYDKIFRLSNNEENIVLKSDLFNILIILSVMFCFIFLIKPGAFEYRWFFPLLPGMLVFTSKGIIESSNFISSFLKIKYLSLILILVLVILGVYTQLYHADQIIKLKVDSYQQVKDSGLWLKENTEPNDVIITASQFQHSYYSERKIENFYVNNSNENETAFNMKIKEIKPAYIVISAFEPVFTPKWAYEWPQKNNASVEPVMVYYFDKDQKELALVIYKFKDM